MKLNRSYNVGFAGLDVYGVPDHSLGHDANTIGVILNWRLKLVGHSILEGKKDHIDNLISVVNAYTRHCISGLQTSISSDCNSVSISSQDNSHLLSLTSSKEGIEPLSIFLDDAELADLTLCLDKLIYDSSVCVNWESIHANRMISKKRSLKSPLHLKFVHLLIGILLFSTSSLLYLRIPSPKLDLPNQAIEKDLNF